MGNTLPAPIRIDLDALVTGDRMARSDAYQRLLQATEGAVPWSGAVWDELLALLSDTDNHLRTIAAQLLCNLAASDRDGHMTRDLDRIIEVTHDERFVTARHTMQSLWKIGRTDPAIRAHLLTRFDHRFNVAAAEKNGTLVRYDLLVGLKHLFDTTDDAAVPALANTLIARETDEKYRKKYLTVWKA